MLRDDISDSEDEKPSSLEMKKIRKNQRRSHSEADGEGNMAADAVMRQSSYSGHSHLGLGFGYLCCL